MRRPAHRPPPWYLGPRPEPISDSYQAEVDASTARLEKRYVSAQKAVARALQRIERAENRHSSATALKTWQDEFERRVIELAAIEALMQPGNIASAQHRGSKSYEKVPK